MTVSSVVVVESDSLEALCTGLLAVFSFRSPGVFGAAAELVAAVLKSKAVPGVFGVLLADPNAANAPDPRPNADDPVVVGEARLVLVKGEMALKGFLPPCDELSPPRRFEAENVRDGASALSPWDVDSESLLVLLHHVSQSTDTGWAGHTWNGGSTGYLLCPLEMRGQTGGGRTAGRFNSKAGATLGLKERRDIKRIAGGPVARAAVRAAAEERERRRGGDSRLGRWKSSGSGIEGWVLLHSAE